MQYYYKSDYGRNRYKKRMHAIWDEMGMFNVAQQKLVDLKTNILQKKWMLDLELVEIQRNIEDIGNGKMGLKSYQDDGWFLGFYHEGQDIFMKE